MNEDRLAPAPPAPLRAAERARLRAALLDHYDAHARPLPWRADADPYRVWVSEVMLQQTRVETVLGYYEPWLERFPDVHALAAADRDEVLLAWAGLGYYRRARLLHDAAALVRDRHDGELPGGYQALRELPGFGEYTAGAVASIAFGEAVPAVDGNVRRVLARWFDEPEPTAAWLRRTAAELVDPERPGDWNQALMELGATVCTPAKPRCDACPVARGCAARAAGTQHARPRPAKARAPRTATFACLVLADGRGRVLVERRPADGLLGGMWAFPEREVGRREDAAEAALGVMDSFPEPEPAGTEEAALRPLAPVRHRFSHIDATYVPFLARTGPPDGPEAEGGATEGAARDGSRRSGPPPPASARTLRWIHPASPDVALPVAQAKIATDAARHLRGAAP